MEREGILSPVRRVRYPAPLVRRLALEEGDRHPSEKILEPIERDDTVAKAALSLHGALCFPTRSITARDAESPHILDKIRPEHAPFIQTEFSRETFVPWDDFKVFAYLIDGDEIYAGDRFYPTFYHAWQVFFLATYLRTAAMLLYAVDDDAVSKAMWEGRLDDDAIRKRRQVTFNIEARHELHELRKYENCFDAVSYFQDYSRNALQRFGRHADEHGRLAPRHWQAFRAREKQIAAETLGKYGLNDKDLIDFVKAQCKWWNDAERRGPALLADEWKRHIGITLDFHRAATGATHEQQSADVGRVTGHFKPTLDVVFPSWIKEQRELAFRSLKPWAADGFDGTPTPFTFNDTELDELCKWLEEKKLYQFYWIYRRAVEGRHRDDPVQRAATTADVANFANLAEMIANEVLLEKGTPPRGPRMTLVPKLRLLFGPAGPVDLNRYLSKHRSLMRTEHQTLRQRLAQIARLKSSAGAHTPVLRYLLALVAIRNEGSHLGLLRFDRIETMELTRLISLASLAIWKTR
ncbi:hypothetical protein CW354_04705 [Marinicaulis flavus]|uniref:Uncharacterized protein n=2 Tax=Hyphococcus luteus TaxID=2058213 RepID=A0A2S7K9Q2_9PROT|nr:hypothetical protein CW354_04705 [Marinicaulis flavus]